MIDITKFDLPFLERITLLNKKEKWWSICIGFMRYIWIYEEEKVFKIIVHTNINIETGIGAMSVEITCKKERDLLESSTWQLFHIAETINALKKVF
jgi:hypothetical protein